MTRAEQETTIRWDAEEQIVHIWSAQPKVWRRMVKLGVRESRPASTMEGKPVGRWYTVPLDRFRWGVRRAGGKRAGNPAALAQARIRKAAG